MKLLFLGAGGVGGYFGARLIEAGADVTFLLRPGRKARIEAEGLRVESPYGDFQVAPRCLLREELQPEFDLVVLTSKAYDLEVAIDAIAPAMGAEGRVLPFLNGLAHMDRLDARFGADRVVGGVAHIAGELTEDGVVRQLNRIHSLAAGGRDEATKRVAERFVELCGPARFDCRLVADIEATLWEKWAFLATLAGMTTLMRASVGAILATTHGEVLTRRLYDECLATAAAYGKPVAAEGQHKALAMLTEAGSRFAASMLRDLQAGHRTEHEHVLGDLAHRAQTADVDAPVLQAAYAQMQVRDHERTA
ncbi:MAG: 2-dehydropantoate 2-reductase [Rhodocyclaceae bacterium]|nr:2-dehydropantoate 2-reductase [Rhodocyclaceae bacterium]